MEWHKTSKKMQRWTKIIRECTVCKKQKPERVMQFLRPIEDWICDDCLGEGRRSQVTSLEEGKELTAELRGEQYNAE